MESDPAVNYSLCYGRVYFFFYIDHTLVYSCKKNIF